MNYTDKKVLHILKKRQSTHRSCKVAVKLLDDCGKASTRQVQKTPAPTHALSIPPRSWVLLLRGDIPFLFVEQVELEKNPEFGWVREQ